jgi:CRISPR-associated endoribonuclease Cas6
MLKAVVVHLESLRDFTLSGATGRGVHGFWFQHWSRVEPRIAARLHEQRQTSPYTLSPLMGLPRSRGKGIVDVPKGWEAWFRVTTLTGELSDALMSRWIPNLEAGMDIQIPQPAGSQDDGLVWRITGISLASDEHSWAGENAYSQIASQHLMNTKPPVHWRVQFSTPTAFHGAAGHLPFPLPNSLINSWQRRWQEFAPIALPDEMPDLVREGVVVSSYRLRTIPVRQGRRLTVGCVGRMSLRAVKMHPAYRSAVDLLAAFAFYAGSGHRTTQGMGMTRLVG